MWFTNRENDTRFLRITMKDDCKDWTSDKRVWLSLVVLKVSRRVLVRLKILDEKNTTNSSCKSSKLKAAIVCMRFEIWWIGRVTWLVITVAHNTLLCCKNILLLSPDNSRLSSPPTRANCKNWQEQWVNIHSFYCRPSTLQYRQTEQSVLQRGKGQHTTSS